MELIGQTVSLVPLELKHLDQLYEAATPPEIWEWNATRIDSYEDAENYIRNAVKAREDKLHYQFAVIRREDQKLIGSTALRFINFANRSLEIGSTWYHPSCWRTAVNTECKLLLLQHAFEDWKMNRVELRTDERNIRSQSAIRRLGAVQEGILRQEKVIQSGYIRNTVVFSILAEEWPEVKERLTGFLKGKGAVKE